MKLTIIGGGSVFTPMLADGLHKFTRELPVEEIALLDIDEKTLSTIVPFTERTLAQRNLGDVAVTATTDRQEAIEGSDFVVFTIRVGGMEARVRDEKIPLKYGIAGDETTGPGGFSNALRTIPVMVDYARDIERWAPDAWVIPFTNPEGLLTEAISRATGIQVIGLCTAPYGMWKGISAYLGVDPSRVSVEMLGVTHTGWVRKILVDGSDVLPRIVEEALSKGAINELYPAEVIGALDAIPGRWFYALLGYETPDFYYHHDRVYQKQQEAGKTRGEVLIEMRKSFPDLSDENTTIQDLFNWRGHQIMDEPILSLMSAIWNDKNEIHVVDVANNGALEYFDPRAVIEMPAVIGKSGARPQPIEGLSPEVRGLMQSIKAYEELTVRAAVEGSYALALRALIAHPLVMSYEIAKPLLDDILAANEGLLPAYWTAVSED